MMAGVRGEKLLTASDLATLCEVDLKTIHNWVDRGRIAHFRTPGRHLRFRAADVAEFLRAWGYSVPRELARASARTGLVVGSKDTVSHVTRTLGDTMPLRDVKHPYDALVFAGADPPDVFLVDSKSVGADVDVDRWLEALNRACPDARIVVLADDGAEVPSFATHMGRTDAQGLRTLLLPEVPAANAPLPGVPGAAGTPMTAGSAEAPPAQAVGEGLARAVGSR
jgi:excisionase family DNA binding protein